MITITVSATDEEQKYWYSLTPGHVIAKEQAGTVTNLYIYEPYQDRTLNYTMDEVLVVPGQWVKQWDVIGIGADVSSYDVRVYEGCDMYGGTELTATEQDTYLDQWMKPRSVIPASAEAETRQNQLSDDEMYLYRLEYTDENYHGHPVILTDSQYWNVLRALVGEQGTDNTFEIYVGECQYIIDYIEYGDLSRSYDNMGSFWLKSVNSSRVAQYSREDIEACEELMRAYRFCFEQGGRLFQHVLGGYWDDDDAGYDLGGKGAGFDTFEENVNVTCGGFSDHDHDWVTCVHPSSDREWVRFWVCKYRTVNEKGHSHDYAREVTLESTCFSPGYVTYRCGGCGDVYYEELPATWSHEYGDWQPYSTGYHIKYCSLCEHTECESHNWSLYRVYRKIVDGHPGTLYATCKDCGAVSVKAFS